MNNKHSTWNLFAFQLEQMGEKNHQYWRLDLFGFISIKMKVVYTERWQASCDLAQSLLKTYSR